MKENTTTTPAEWPGAFGAYKHSRDAVRHNLSTILQLTLLLIALSISLGILLDMLFGKQFADTFGQLLGYALGIYFTVALTYAYLASVRRRKVDMQAAFAVVPALFWRMFFLNLLITLAVLGGLVLLIVPGLIIALRLSLAPYYLVDRDLGVMEAYKASWHATKDHMGKLWGLLGAGLLMVLPTLTIVGVLASIYLLFMYSAVLALLYLYITKDAKADREADSMAEVAAG